MSFIFGGIDHLQYPSYNGFIESFADQFIRAPAAFDVPEKDLVEKVVRRKGVGVFLIGSQLWLRLVGGLFLLYLGYSTFRSVPAEKAATAGGGGLGGAG